MEERGFALRLPFCIFNFAFFCVLCVENFFLSHIHLQTAIISKNKRAARAALICSGSSKNRDTKHPTSLASRLSCEGRISPSPRDAILWDINRDWLRLCCVAVVTA